MKKPIIAALAGAFVLAASPVFAQSIGERSGVNAVLGISPSTQDFITQAANSDLFEIESARLALERAPDAPTKAFAQHMLTDHTKTSEDLRRLVTAANPQATIPTVLDQSHQEKLDRLRGLSGKDFSDTYRDQQETAHKNAVSLFRRYAEGGDVPTLKEWAAATLPTLEQHLKAVELLNK